MTVGLSSKLRVLRQSPLDSVPSPLDEGTSPVRMGEWVPSRYNVRAGTDDGSLVVWNSFHGTMSVFGPEQRDTVEEHLRRTGVDGPAEGLIEYLVERGFLVQRGTDELRRLRMAFGNQQYRSDILELILLASEDCNFRCTYCYEEFNRGTMQPWVRRAVKKLVERRAPKLRQLKTRWFGGEPLYGLPAIEELAPFFVEVAARHGLRHAGSMTTNGYLLTPDVARKLLAWDVRGFQITLDGPPETHDASRPARDGSGTFATIFDNLCRMRKLDEEFLVDLRVNYDRKNHPYIPRLLDQVREELGEDPRFRLNFFAVGRWGGPQDDRLDVCGTDEAAEVALEMKREARRRGLKLTHDVKKLPGVGAQVCYAARPYNFVVGANGHLMKCTIDLDRKDRNVVGRLTREGNLDLDPDKLAKWTEPAFEDDDKCRKCVVLPVCQGMHCPQIRFDHDTSPCTPLRMNAKQQLREIWSRNQGRKREISVSAPAAGTG